MVIILCISLASQIQPQSGEGSGAHPSGTIQECNYRYEIVNKDDNCINKQIQHPTLKMKLPGSPTGSKYDILVSLTWVCVVYVVKKKLRHSGGVWSINGRGA